MKQNIAVIAGVGPGLGSALCQVFSTNGYTTIALSRSKWSANWKQSGPENQGALINMQCDLTNTAQLKSVFEKISHYGDVSVYVHNAHHLVSESLLRTTVVDFELAWKTITRAAFVGTQCVLPHMLKKQSGTILFTGATASLRGSANFSAFASAKFALRGLAQALAREYSGQGIHCAHVILDGLIAQNCKAQTVTAQQTDLLDPLAIAKQYAMIVNQPATTWSHEIDLRPASEKF